MTVKRYFVVSGNGLIGDCLKESPQGALVLWRDYDALAAEVERLRKRDDDGYGGSVIATTVKCLEEAEAEVERLRYALDWIADPRGNDICTPQEIAEAALAREEP